MMFTVCTDLCTFLDQIILTGLLNEYNIHAEGEVPSDHIDECLLIEEQKSC